ncbi:MAG: NUDIX domain-containing protein [Candidatus Micrarchaeota archaeon]|nr:NUDIX domain-containing protein [Candidatus Micrarchaeota archaeon]
MIISAGIILMKQNKILVLRNRKGHLDFPKGHIEEGESIIEAALREFREETGLDTEKIEIIENLKYTLEYPVIEKGEIQRKRVYLFLAIYRGDDDIKLSKEHVNYYWLELDEKIEEKFKYREHKELIRKVLKDIKSLK